MEVKCPKCQVTNPADAKFCIECGNPIEFHCPKCGAITPAGGRFCKECGHDLGKSKAPPIDYSQPKSYTPKFLADKILTARSSLEGERKLVTVLFADVANYTSMSEKLDPEEVRQIMDGCFQILMDEIHGYEGTINQFTGDGVMALFGAPVAHEDHARRACYAALAIQRALGGYGDKVKGDYGLDFKMRLGLNSGPVVVGSIGNDLRMDYTAMGDTTNLASRMQTMAEPGGILVAPDTYKMARDFFEFQPMGKLKVKGKEEPVEAYQLLKASEVSTRIEASVIRGLTRFVGRDKEMATLKEAFEKAKSGSGQVVGVVGEAGVGKSRLLLELRRGLPEGEYTYLQGSCLHYGGSMAYLPFLDILRAYFDIKEGDRESIIKKKMAEKTGQLDEKLKDILPPLQDILSLKVEDDDYLKLDPPLKKVKIFEAMRDLLVRVSQDRPLVLAVEDLHWMDKTSEEFLGYLIGFLANAHILLLLLYRPEYTHQWGSKSYYHQIGVDQLSLASSRELVQSILEEGEVVPELRELILNRAAGNPLFMEEFTHTLLENGSIRRKNHEYVLTRKASEIQVPDTIQGIIAARMDRLEENLKRTMQVASVIGRDFAYRILQTITGMREELKSYLINLQGLEFIYEKSLFPELEYIFKHALTQEVAYNSLLLKRRKEIHERIGKAIEEIYADRLDEFYEMLAYHYLRAENWEKAYHYLLSSAMKAGMRYSMSEAFRLGREALNVLGKMPQTEANKRRGIDARDLLAAVMTATGWTEDSLQILQEGDRLSRELSDEKALTRFHGYIGNYYLSRGDTQESVKYLEGAFQAAEKAQDIELMAPIAFQLCWTYDNIGYMRKEAETTAKVIALLESTHRESESFGWDPFNPYAALVAYHGNALANMGDFEEGLTQCEKALRFAAKMNEIGSMGIVESFYGWCYLLEGDGRKAIEHEVNAIRYLEAAQLVGPVGTAWIYLGYGYGLLGQMDAGISHMKKGLEIDVAWGLPYCLAFDYSCLSVLYRESGDLDNARTCAEKALEMGEKWFPAAAMASTVLGSTLGKMDSSKSAKAEEFILRGIKAIDENEGKPWQVPGNLYLGEFYVDTGQRQKALNALRKALVMAQEMGMTGYWLARTEKALEKLRSGGKGGR